MSGFAYAVNALGEVICPGCGCHMTPPSHSRFPLVYCSGRCKKRVQDAGGRYTRDELKEAIDAVIRGDFEPSRLRATPDLSNPPKGER